MPTPPAIPAETYTRRRDAFAAEEARLARISFRFSLLRAGLFLAFFVCLVVILLQRGRVEWGWWAGAVFWLAAFVWVLPYHDRVIQRQRRGGGGRRGHRGRGGRGGPGLGGPR